MLKNSSWFLSFCWVTVSFIDFRKIHTFILLYNILIHMLTRLYHLLTLFWSLQQNFTVSYIGPTHYFFYKYMHICIIPCVFLINNRITGNSLAVQCLGFPEPHPLPLQCLPGAKVCIHKHQPSKLTVCPEGRDESGSQLDSFIRPFSNRGLHGVGKGKLH